MPVNITIWFFISTSPFAYTLFLQERTILMKFLLFLLLILDIFRGPPKNIQKWRKTEQMKENRANLQYFTVLWKIELFEVAAFFVNTMYMEFLQVFRPLRSSSIQLSPFTSFPFLHPPFSSSFTKTKYFKNSWILTT